jgi:hypothetical protein
VISDDSTAGTPDDPLWISDGETTDNESQADNSNIAIRGVRKAQPSLTKAPASTARKEMNKVRNQPQETLEQAREKKSADSAPKTAVRTTIAAKLASRRNKKLPSQKASLKETNSTAKEGKSPSIDIKLLSKEEDPILEQELEEIALNWRIGAISGTPSAHDVEKGKEKESSIPSFVPPSSLLAEDDADRSWHNPITGLKPKSKKRQRWYLLLSLTGLLVITGSLIHVLVNNKSNKLVKETEPDLTQQQQTMHDFIARITDASILNNPNTPQHQARKWLLFRDSDFSSSAEEKIIQRYVLACFFFATGGKEKWEENNWMIGSECGENPWTGLGCTSEGEVQALVIGTYRQHLSGQDWSCCDPYLQPSRLIFLSVYRQQRVDWNSADRIGSFARSRAPPFEEQSWTFRLDPRNACSHTIPVSAWTVQECPIWNDPGHL